MTVSPHIPLFPEKMDGKLKSTLFPKVQYKAHIANLRLGMELGYQMTWYIVELNLPRGSTWHLTSTS
jgi:hypothetical protein